MKRLPVALLASLCFGSAVAQGRLYSDDFETRIQPLFPLVGGTFQLPAGPAADQLAWLLAELAAGENTTEAEAAAHFAPELDIPEAAAFINSLRSSFPNARVRDVVRVSPVRLDAVIESPGAGPPYGFVFLDARYTGERHITFLDVVNFSGSVQLPVDQNLTLVEAADKFVTLSPQPSLFVGRIRPGGVCEPIIERQPDQLRATASIVKTWVLGGVARAVANNTLTALTPIPLVASELVPGAIINIEPIGTLFPAGELATIMMADSDNTATDLLHEQVGRPMIDQVVTDYAMSQPTVLTPLLGIGEQFHVLTTFDLPTANAYVNGTEAFQQEFLDGQIVPLGPCCAGSTFFHTGLLTAGTWRATAADVCRAFAGLRRTAQGSDAFDIVDRAMGSNVVQVDTRHRWQRVWYKAGALQSGAQIRVLAHAWLLEDADRDPYVVVSMSDSPTTNPNTVGIDQRAVHSLMARILRLVDELP